MLINSKQSYLCFTRYWYKEGVTDLVVLTSENAKENYVKSQIASGKKMGLVPDYGYPPYVNMTEPDGQPVYEIVTQRLHDLIGDEKY